MAEIVPATYGPLFGDDYVQHLLDAWCTREMIATSVANLPRWLAVDDAGGVERIVGTSNLGTLGAGSPWAGEPVVWSLYVAECHQGTGLGSRLLTAARAAVPPDQHRLLLSHADGNDKAAAFYARKGFVEVGRIADGAWPAQVWRALPLSEPNVSERRDPTEPRRSDNSGSGSG